MTVAVIADIVASRALADRRAGQRAIEAALAATHRDLPVATAALRATVGDEFQGVYPTLPDALRVVLLVRLSLPDGIDLRFGLGVGDIRPLGSSSGELSDGPGWWAARAAIEEVHRLQRRAVPSARSWAAGAVGAGEEDDGMPAEIALANAYALARDALVSAMKERTRRLVRGRCLGITQQELAAAEGISQSAVSQLLGAAGAPAVVAGYAGLSETT